jgi:transposase
MRAYLGIDAHSKTGLELAAVAEDGELLWRDRCPLSSKLIADAVQRAPRPCTTVFEQGELATWLHMTLRHLCDQVLVADPRHNRLIATAQDKHDAFDAFTLANLARGGYLREVFQPAPEFTVLRLQVRHHYRLTQHVTTAKNQIKASYRAQGISVSGSSVYRPAARAQWLQRLPATARSATEDLYAVLDVAEARKDAALRTLSRAARRFAPAQRMLKVPQVGPVTAATFTAFLVTPRRFPSRSHIWSYCGFGIMTRSSGHRAEPTRLRRSYNRHLKRTIKSAALRLITHSDGPFAAAYQARLQRGMLPSRARLTLSRKLIDVLCALWINEEDYNPERIQVH